MAESVLAVEAYRRHLKTFLNNPSLSRALPSNHKREPWLRIMLTKCQSWWITLSKRVSDVDSQTVLEWTETSSRLGGRKNAFINLKTYGHKSSGSKVKGWKVKEAWLLRYMASCHWISTPCVIANARKWIKNLDSAMAAQCVSPVVPLFHVKPCVSHDKSFIMTILYSLNPTP